MAKPAGEWTTGLCGCFEDCGSCCCVLWCPCIQVGRNLEIISEGRTDCGLAGGLWYLLQVVTGLGCLYTCGYRKQLREKFGLPESPCIDCCVHLFCTGCAYCQEARELKNRGMDPALGWIAVAQRSQQGAPGQYPPYQQPMQKY